MLKNHLENFYTLKLEIGVITANKKELDEALEAKKKALENTKNEIDQILKSQKKTAIAEHGFVLSYRKSAKVVITDENALPSEAFEMVKKICTLTKMKELIKNGIVQGGAVIAEQKNLQIKKMGALDEEDEDFGNFE